jgi:hypothetical protein
MSKAYIEYNNKKYPIRELTIEMWANIMKFKNILDQVDLYVKMIADMTGLTTEQVRDGDANELVKCGELLYSFINQESKQVYNTIKHNDVEYELADFGNISFGQFVDIDSFIMKDEAYKIANLNELASYLYTEKGKKYGETDFKKSIENFKTLPMKYVEGAVFFLWTLEKELFGLSQVYSKNKWIVRGVRILLIFLNFGATISGLLNSQRTKFGKLTVLLVSPLFFVSTICRSLVIYIRNKIKR